MRQEYNKKLQEDYERYELNKRYTIEVGTENLNYICLNSKNGVRGNQRPIPKALRF